MQYLQIYKVSKTQSKEEDLLYIPETWFAQVIYYFTDADNYYANIDIYLQTTHHPTDRTPPFNPILNRRLAIPLDPLEWISLRPQGVQFRFPSPANFSSLSSKHSQTDRRLSPFAWYVGSRMTTYWEDT